VALANCFPLLALYKSYWLPDFSPGIFAKDLEPTHCTATCIVRVFSVLDMWECVWFFVLGWCRVFQTDFSSFSDWWGVIWLLNLGYFFSLIDVRSVTLPV